MKIHLIAVGVATALTFTACESANTNTNRALNNANNAVVVNSNATNSNSLSPVTTTNTNATINANRTSINYNGTAKENEASRTNIEQEAKGLGSTIGTGAEDWWIWTKTRTALATENDLRDSTINVDVSNSVITLRGNVRNKEQVGKADKVAKTISGQKGVVNKLAVSANDTALPNMTNSNSNMSKAPVKKS